MKYTLVGAWSEKIKNGWSAGQYRVRVKYQWDGDSHEFDTYLHHVVPEEIANEIVSAIQAHVTQEVPR
jgi:hypothetical protein